MRSGELETKILKSPRTWNWLELEPFQMREKERFKPLLLEALNYENERCDKDLLDMAAQFVVACCGGHWRNMVQLLEFVNSPAEIFVGDKTKVLENLLSKYDTFLRLFLFFSSLLFSSRSFVSFRFVSFRFVS